MSVEIEETVKKTKFSLKREEHEIELEDENGNLGKYIVREMSGAQRDQYLKTAMQRAKFDTNGQVTQVTDPTGLQPMLISLCLVDRSTGGYVDMKFANAMPTTVQTEIFELCAAINGLDKEADAKSKND